MNKSEIPMQLTQDLELEGRGLDKKYQELIRVQREEFIAYVKQGNTALITVTPIEETRFVSNPSMVGSVLAGTLYATRYQTEDYAGNTRKTFTEENEFYSGVLPENERLRYTMRNHANSMTRALLLSLRVRVLTEIKDPLVYEITI
jgi:hypothetical protein